MIDHKLARERDLTVNKKEIQNLMNISLLINYQATYVSFNNFCIIIFIGKSIAFTLTLVLCLFQNYS